MADIRLIAIDLDGTLLTDDKQVCGAACEALQQLASRGMKIVLASARPPRSVRAFYHQLGLDTWQINYNGAMIWDEPAQRVVAHQPMAGEVVLRLIEHARRLHADVIAECEILDRWHTDRVDARFATATGKLFKPDALADMADICRESVTMVNLLGDPAEIARIETELVETFAAEIELIRTGDHDLLTGKHPLACKSNALRQVAGHYGVAMNQAMAIGDAPNDIGMLREVGFGVAMGNAAPAVKAVADWVAPANGERGIVAALQRFSLLP